MPVFAGPNVDFDIDIYQLGPRRRRLGRVVIAISWADYVPESRSPSIRPALCQPMVQLPDSERRHQAGEKQTSYGGK